MYLVHEKKHRDGRWEVAWMWLPHFLAADKELHKDVDQKMTLAFKGTMLEGDAMSMYPPSMTPILEMMHRKVIELILEKYPIPGLKELLEAYSHLQPDKELKTG